MKRAGSVIAAVLLAIAAAGLLRAQVTQPGPTYPLWEYRIEVSRGTGSQELAEGTLNALGREGWELTALTRREVRIQDLMQTETVFVFKRSRGEARR